MTESAGPAQSETDREADAPAGADAGSDAQPRADQGAARSDPARDAKADGGGDDGEHDRLPHPPPAPPRPPDSRSWLRRGRDYLAVLGRGVWRKGQEDNLFFLAGAISFNVLVAFLPLVLAIIGIAGSILGQSGRAQATLIQYLDRSIPAAINLPYERLIDDLAKNSTGILSIGTLFFLWIATRLVGTLRSVLREIFDIPEGRSIVSGKIFDIKMVLAAGSLFVINILLTVGLRLGAGVAGDFTGIHVEELPLFGQATALWPQLVAFGTIWVMFLLIYRYLPPRRIQWSTAAIAATFTAVLGEILKYGFTWYVQNVAEFDQLWGNVTTFVILVLWIYYTSVVFIVGGEVAQVVSMQRTRKRQKERLG